MKKVYFVSLIILIVVLVLGIIVSFKQYYDIKNEIKMKEELIEQRQDINKEYVYLFKQTKNDIKKEIMDEQKKVERNLVAIPLTLDDGLRLKNKNKY